MKKIESHEDQMRGVITYEFDDGRRINFDANAVRDLGVSECLRMAGHGDQVPTERRPVIQYGKRIGTMAPDFDPATAKSTSPWYDVRPGDFRLEDGAWVADRTLGASDVDCVAGFVRDQR